MNPYRKGTTAIVFILLLLSLSCAAITGYDATSYKTATDLKAESLLLMDKATEPPDDNQMAQIDELQVKLLKAYEYEKGKKGPNQITVAQWKLLNDPEKDLLGGFLKDWEAKKGQSKGFSKAFIDEKKDQVGKAFDQIIELESSKVKD
jgi:hypothetical protein